MGIFVGREGKRSVGDMNKGRIAAAFLFLLSMCPARSLAQGETAQQPKTEPVPVALADKIVSRLPEAYRAEAKSLLTATEDALKQVQAKQQ